MYKFIKFLIETLSISELDAYLQSRGCDGN